MHRPDKKNIYFDSIHRISAVQRPYHLLTVFFFRRGETVSVSLYPVRSVCGGNYFSLSTLTHVWHGDRN